MKFWWVFDGRKGMIGVVLMGKELYGSGGSKDSNVMKVRRNKEMYGFCCSGGMGSSGDKFEGGWRCLIK